MPLTKLNGKDVLLIYQILMKQMYRSGWSYSYYTWTMFMIFIARNKWPLIYFVFGHCLDMI